ncbi:MAG: acetoacetyl-CoA reductase [Alphaproteobacteria bacterium]
MKRVAVVTGGTRGIGRAIVATLSEAGYTVAATYHGNDQAAQECADALGVKVFKWDVADYESCQAGLAKIEEEVGPVDVLVNNAGITRDTMIHKMDPDMWSAVIHTNLDSIFNMCRIVVPGMRERGYGRIVNISSINGQKGQMGQTNYSAAKAGVIGFTKALAQETARKGITVNCICPGYIDTDMVAAVPQAAMDQIIASIPVGRLGKAEEIAHCVMFLADERAGFVTGSVVTANGGQYIANG